MTTGIQFPNQPLADRMRPETLDDFIGQKHLVGPNAVIRKMVQSGSLSSFILWGQVTNADHRRFLVQAYISPGVGTEIPKGSRPPLPYNMRAR